MLQHTAIYCNTLQHTATPTCQAEKKQTASQVANVAIAVVVKQIQALGDAKVAVLQGAALTATHCITLQHTATHCNTLQHTATHCNTLHSNILQHTASHCTATYCNTRLVTQNIYV